jgi:hypothetical protein
LRLTLELLRLTQELLRPTLELLRLTLEPWIKSCSHRVSPDVTEAYGIAMEASYGAMETLLQSAKAHSGAVELNLKL